MKRLWCRAWLLGALLVVPVHANTTSALRATLPVEPIVTAPQAEDIAAGLLERQDALGVALPQAPILPRADIDVQRGIAEAGTDATEVERNLKIERADAGYEFRDCDVCPRMVKVPAGSFMMGSPSSEPERYDAEGPVHGVDIAYAFAVGVYEVTFDEWDACVAAGGCSRTPADQGWGRGKRPVIYVDWDDAQQYVRWLSAETEERYRLLSESEWEYVARAGTTTRYHFGDSIASSQANYDENVGETVPVGSYPANAFGLHDVHGNVWEWVQDCWNRSYRGSPNDGSAWESGDCSRRVLRGGSLYNWPKYLRSANRYWNTAGSRYLIAGFRVARALTP